MATTTTNYGFDVPTSSDLVKNGATAISTLGQDIDTFLFRPFSKNAVINGAMDIWQRSTSSTSNATYNSADRWWNYSNAGTTTWSRESTIVPTGSLYSMKIAQAGSTSTNTQMNQVIETLNAVQYAGKTITLSAQFCASASTTVFVSVSYSTATDVAPTGAWTGITAASGTSIATSATTTSFTQLSGQFAIPSTAKSLLVVIGSTSVAAGTNVYVGQVQFETGSQSTPFSRAGGTIQGELAACQRYYEKSYDLATAPATAVETGSFGFCVGTNSTAANYFTYAPVFKVAKRGTPTITLYDLSGNSGKVNKVSATDLSMTANQTATADRIGETEFRIYSALNTAGGFYGHYVASAEL